MSRLRSNESSFSARSSREGYNELSLSQDISECKLCRKITLAQLISPTGCLHAPNRKALVRSGQKCRLCSLIFRKDRLGRGTAVRDMGIRLRLAKDKGTEVLFLVEHIVEGDDVHEPKGRTIKLKVFTEMDDPALECGVTLRRTLTSTKSQESFRFAQDQLHNCLQYHDCGTSLPLDVAGQSTPLWPTRLIDCRAFEDSSDVRLINDVHPSERYAALSYCWGKTHAFVTTTRSLRDRQTRIVYNALPKTFKDLIDIACHLDIRYVWVDALCIVQDDVGDWSREASKMGAIYSKAYLTVAADASSDSDGGCFNQVSTSQDLLLDQAPFSLQIKADDDHTSCLYLWDPSQGTFATFRTSHPEIDSSPLSDRGWICQERILSPRVLHYTQSQLFWECRCGFASEDGLQTESRSDSGSSWLRLSTNNRTGPSLARNLYQQKRSLLSPLNVHISDIDPSFINGLISIWYNSVIAATYSHRSLTRPDDKLPAISGIARVFYHHLHRANLTYVAGVWAGASDDHVNDIDLSSVFAQGLAWRRRGPVTRSVQYRAPSFSWAALDAQIEWPAQLGNLVPTGASQTQFVDKLESAIEVVDVNIITPKGNDVFGRILEGSFVELYAYMTRLTIIVRRRISAMPLPPPASLRQTLSSASNASLSSDVDMMSFSTPILTQTSATGPAIAFTWEIINARRKWIGTASVDDDVLRPAVLPSSEVTSPEKSHDELVDGTVEVVDAMLLEREDHGGRSRYLLLQPITALDRPVIYRRASEKGERHDATSDEVWSFRRIGVGEIHGLDDAEQSQLSQLRHDDERQEMVRLRLY